MKEMLSHLYRFCVLIILAITIQACGSDTPDPKAGYSISADVSRINFTHEELAEPTQSFSIAVNYSGDGLLIGYAPNSQPVPWLNFRTEKLTDTTANVIIELANVSNYQQNLYQTTLRLSTGDVQNAALVHHDIDVSLLIAKLLSFSATLGETSIDSQTIELSIDSANWTFGTDVDWLTVEAETIDGETTLTITPTIIELDQPDLYQGNIIITENASGDVDNIPVELGIDNLYLVASQPSVAFTQALNVKALTQSLKINTNSIEAVQWQASSDQSWLIVSKSDTNTLNISVDQTKIPNDEFNNALITVSAIENPAIISAEIPVSLFNSDLIVENTVISDLPVNNNALISAINKPYFYVAVKNELHTYHQYTGELINTVTVSPVDSLLEQLILHPNGKTLLAKAAVTTTTDDTSTTTTHRFKINLVDDSVTELIDSTTEYEPLTFVTFAGRHFVVTQALEFADENLNRLYWDSANAFNAISVDQASETDALYALDGANSTFKKITARVNDFTTNKIIPKITTEYRPESLPENGTIANFIVSDNEAAIFLNSATSEWITIEDESYTDNGLLTQTEGNTTLAVNKDKHGNIAFTRFDPVTGIIVDIYSQQANPLNTIITNGQVPQAVAITQDNKQLVIQANNQVELVALETIAVSNNNLEFVGTFGDSNISEQTITLNNIGSQWFATSSVNWLSLTQTTIDEQESLTLAIDTSLISGWGLYTGVVTIVDPDTGNNIEIVVELAIDEVRLFANYPALSFDQQVDRSLLSQTVKVNTNKATNVAWQATTNVNWLMLNEDSINNTLTVTVDPNLAANGTHYAEIKLTPTSLDESVEGLISVSFTKGNYDTTQQSEISVSDVTPNQDGFALDPLRPYIYVAQFDNIDVYNLIDGSKVTTIASPLEGLDLINLVIHPNGSLLLAANIETYLDDEEKEQQRVNHYQVNLDSFSINELDSEQIDISYLPEKIAIIDGKAIVITQAMEYANMALTVQSWNTAEAFFTTTMHKIPNNNHLLAYNQNNASIIESALKVNVFATNTISSTVVTASPDVNYLVYGLPNITTSNNGIELYSANSATEWSSYTNNGYVRNGVLPSSQTISTIKVHTDSADNSYVYRKTFINGYGEAHTLTQYDSQQQQVDFSAYSAGSNNVLISPTYHRLIHFDDEKLVMDFTKQ